MTGFSREWLQLREPCDVRARSKELVVGLRSLLPLRPLNAVDLGAGTGANVRYMAPLLGGEQHWITVDNDPKLIERQPSSIESATFQCSVTSQRLDLVADFSSLPLSGCRLVTASALLDLVSANWLAALASRCADQSATVLFSLSYDGRMQCLPRDPDDDWLIGLVNLHQRGDKGFGCALGPDATEHARQMFAALNYEWRVMPSDWVIEPGERAMQRELMAGWMDAAREVAPAECQRIDRWGSRREAHLDAGESLLRVGHQDFMAWPKSSDG